MEKSLIIKNRFGTKEFALALANSIQEINPKLPYALVISLSGELGTGKTTFTQFFARAFKVKGKVLSPTFIVVRSHRLLSSNYNRLFHIDYYRMRSVRELKGIGWNAIIKNPKHIVLVEWGEKIKSALPQKHVTVRFKHGEKTKTTDRIINVSFHGL